MSKGSHKRKCGSNSFRVQIMRRTWIITVIDDIVKFTNWKGQVRQASLEKFKDASGRFRIDQVIHYISRKYS